MDRDSRSLIGKVSAPGVLRILLIVVAIWLAWLIVRGVIVQNAPADLAARIAADSPTVLSRAAEAEFAAGRPDNAAFLARHSLSKAPFDVRALRVVGLTEAGRGNLDQADQIITLAGNWSLRDDPSHAWLVERRLRQGEYISAFAHADAIARRRRDLDASIFNLFTTAAVQDPRGLRAIAAKLRDNPPWRKPYLESALRSDAGQTAAINLAVLLNSTTGRFSDQELETLYMALLTQKRVGAVRVLADRLGRPKSRTLNNGQFDASAQTKPFDWMLKVSDGVIAEFMPDDADPDRMALRVEYNGNSTQRAVEQALLLSPGSYVLSGSTKSEDAGREDALQWVVTCLETGRAVSSPARRQAPRPFVWSPFRTDVVVPDTGCSAQWLTLMATPGGRTGSTIMWFDDMEIRP